MAVALAALSIALVLCALATIAYAWWQSTRPMTETEEKCSRIDVELNDVRAAGSIRHYTGGGWKV